MGPIDWADLAAVWPLLLKGLLYTLRLTLVAGVGGTLLGVLLAVARLSHARWLSRAAQIYVDAMRSIPLVLVLFGVYLLGPQLLQWILASDYPPLIGADRAAYVTFVLFEAAYFCEIVRAGIVGLPRGQSDAALALGLTPRQAMRLVLLPQALRHMLPVLLTQLIVLFQDVSLVGLINATDLVAAAEKIAQRDNTMVTMYGTVGVVYLVVSLALSQGVGALGRRLAIPR